MLPESTDVKHLSQSCSVTIQAQEEAVSHEEAVSARKSKFPEEITDLLLLNTVTLRFMYKIQQSTFFCFHSIFMHNLYSFFFNLKQNNLSFMLVLLVSDQ
jgi:hypothetical protein